MRAEDRDWRCRRRHRRRTLDGEPRSPDSDGRGTVERRERGLPRANAPTSIGGFELSEASPVTYGWRSCRCRVRISLAHNRWETVFRTTEGEPQIEHHATLRGAIAYATGYMEQHGRPGAMEELRTSPWYDATVLDEVEVAIGEVQEAIDDIPDMADVSRAILERE